MAMKLHEAHPSLVHYRELGRITMPLAAGSTVLVAMTGLIAQQAVDGTDEAFDQAGGVRSGAPELTPRGARPRVV